MGLLVRVAQSSRHLTFSSVRLISSFKAEELQVRLTSTPAAKPDNDKLTFGHHFTDHMLEIDWSEKHGWAPPVIKPVTTLNLHPAAKVFHYACELFEGMKAYRCVDGKIRLFRPMENMSRMAVTGARTSLPSFDTAELLKCLKKLVSVDQEWVPYSEKCSLYIRPTFIGIEPTLGITYPNEAKIFIILGPVGPYFPTGMKPISLLADPQYVRAWPGGCGNFKMGSNYAPTVSIQAAAAKLGCQQVLWLYGDDHEMTEVGTMNLFVYWINEQGEEELITPPLESGLILPGITRKSLLELAREWSEFKVTEQKLTMSRFVKAIREGRVKEVFGAGTACIVCPVDKILYQGEELVISTMNDPEHLTQRFYKEINDIHYYRKAHPWMETIEEDTDDVLRTFGAQ
ncbi:branched-chain-amino-acid aminotransferase, cytosolic [Aplysia californica]|uniref:Branched-chain-amino-acid aminotransferase n=1 Tax=Aplysia californica TaxID=6500 RepID=A0ABM1AEZ8_APLCA|nr:branched-chain-amino-acid aminotransferase, cytosolic [Aplysia californica]